jgi:hypothetical protein
MTQYITPVNALQRRNRQYFMNMEDPLDRPDLAGRRQDNSYGDPAAISIAASRRPVL